MAKGLSAVVPAKKAASTVTTWSEPRGNRSRHQHNIRARPHHFQPPPPPILVELVPYLKVGDVQVLEVLRTRCFRDEGRREEMSAPWNTLCVTLLPTESQPAAPRGCILLLPSCLSCPT